MTKVIALELARTNITCNAICPGWVETEIMLKQVEALKDKHKVTLD
jgi:3-hydroxybutyrate dehydrogenase